MKNIFKFLMVAAALTVAASDEKPVVPEEPEKPEVELNQDLEFTLEVTEVTADQAKIKVSHNGTATDTWYGFVTSNVTEKDGNLITAEVKALLATGKISGLKKQTSTTITLRGLDPQTDYKYIAVGLSEEGEVYGVYKSISFKTIRDTSILEETDDWTISYQRGENEGEVAEIFTIECAEVKGFYFTTIDAESLDLAEMTINDYVKYVIEVEVPTYIEEYGYKWSELYIPEAYTLASPRMISSDYIAFAIGYDSEGEPTGYYSTQEFTVVEETATEAYNQWLGEWEITDNYVYVDEETGEEKEGTATYTVKLHHADNNFLYAMTGWEENGDIYNDIREYVGEYAVPVYFNNGKLSFVETTLEYVEFEGAGTYAFGFYGMGDLVYQGQKIEGTLLGFEGLEMAEGTTEDGKTGTITGQSYTKPYEMEYLGMFYCALPASGQGDLEYWNAPMEFPLTMTKVESEEAPATKALSTPSFKASDLKTKTTEKINKMQKKEFTPMYLK